MIRTLWKKRELLMGLVKRDIKARYKASFLGFFWSIGRPLFLSLIIIFVFSIIYKFPLPSDPVTGRETPFSLHILSGILVWFYFSGAISEAVSSILANYNLVKKIRIQTEVIPVAVVLSNLIHFILALFVYCGFLLAFRNLPGWEVIFLPFVLIIQTIFILGRWNSSKTSSSLKRCFDQPE